MAETVKALRETCWTVAGKTGEHRVPSDGTESTERARMLDFLLVVVKWPAGV